MEQGTGKIVPKKNLEKKTAETIVWIIRVSVNMGIDE
jgi:hypothetical protein